MATRHEITSIQFKADAGKANAAIDSIRQEAAKAAEKVKELRQKLEEGKKANLPTEQISELEAGLRKASKEANQWNAAQRNLLKGVKALDEAIIQFNKGRGSVENMSAALSKTARNAAFLQRERSDRGSQTWKEMDALILALDKNMAKARTDMEALLETIEGGGKVSTRDMKELEQTLKDLSDLSVHGSEEWMGYQRQLTVVQKAITDVGVAERRMKGEMVDANDARRQALKLTEQGADAAARERKEAEGVIAASKERIGELRKERQEKESIVRATQESISAQEEEMAIQAGVVAELEKQVKTEEKKITKKKEAADKARAAAEEAKRNADTERAAMNGAKEATAAAAAEVDVLKKKLEELNAQAAKPQVDTSGIDELKAKLKEAEDVLATKTESSNKAFNEYLKKRAPEYLQDYEEYRSKFTQMYGLKGGRDYSHIGAMDKIQFPFDMARYDVEDAAKGEGDWEVGKEQAKQILDDYHWFEKKIQEVHQKISEQYNKLIDASAKGVDPEQLKTVANNIKKLEDLKDRMIKVATGEDNTGYGLGVGSTFREQFGDIDKQMSNTERNIDRAMKKAKEEVIDFHEKKHEAEIKAAKDVSSRADAEKKAAEETVAALEKKLKELTESSHQSTEADKEKAEVEAQLKQKTEELTKAIENEEAKRKELEAATKAEGKAQEEAKKKEKELAEATTNTSNKLDEERKKQQQLEQARDKDVETLNRQQAELKETNSQIAQEGKVMQEAEAKKAQAKELTIKAMEEMVSLLQKENNEVVPANTAQWQKNKEKIEELQQAIREAKGEVMSMAEAEALADKAMEEQARSTKTGWAAGTEELRRAESVLADKVAKAKRGTKEEEAAYQKLLQKLQAVRTELNSGSVTGKRMMTILNDPKAYSNVETLKKAIARARAELNALGDRIDQAKASKNKKEVKKLQKTYDDLAKSVKETDIRMKELQNSSKGTASAFDKAWSRLKTYVGLYVGASVAMQKLASTMSDVLELSDKMGEVRKTTGFTADEVGRLSDNLTKLDTRTSLTNLMEVSAKAGQLGLKTEEDVYGFTEAANKLMVALPEMGAEAATHLLKVALATGEIDKIRKQMEDGLIDGSSAVAVAMTKVGSTIDQLRANSSSAAPAITDFVQRVGAVGAQSGISIDQVAALGSTVDALGMRVEMSATALSRMIPAIKNNAFDLARAIGVTPDTIRNLFDTGRGMEVILMILQHIKDSGLDDEGIEKMLGMGGLQDIMKDLNQQGARAGIVFAGLSQNVDELRRQLGIARTAYEENTAIQREYDKMNDTTAAKWERLKNQMEEFFVSDSAQRFFGLIIDGLRKIVDLLTGNGGISIAIRTIILYISVLKVGLGEGLVKALKSVGTGIKNIGVALGLVKGEMAKLQLANVFTAIAAAALYAVIAIKDWISAANETARDAAKFEAELLKEQAKVEDLTNSIGKARAKTEEANREVEKAKGVLDEAKRSTDGSRESTEKLAKAQADLVSAQEKEHSAMAEHKRLIESFNNEYGKYLGFMLSEISSDLELAQARELLNDKLRETITLKRKEAALGRVEEDLGEDRDDAYADLWKSVQDRSTVKDENGKYVTDPTKAARAMTALTKAAQQEFASVDAYKEYVKKIYTENSIVTANSSLIEDAVEYYEELNKIREKSRQIEEQFAAEESVNRERSQKDLQRQYQTALRNYEDLALEYRNSAGETRKKAAANLLKQMDTITEMVDNSGNYYDMMDANEKESYDKFIKGADERVNGMKETRENLLKEAGDAYTQRKTVGGGKTTVVNQNPWGRPQPATSLNYADMNAEQLVHRRKQMRDFVNAIQTDTDVNAVLAEDKALKEAIEKGMSSDMRTVIEWYNTERLKIQEELKGRHLTNEGNWRDPKKGGSRKSRTPMSDAALAELERYYAWRKEKIEEARAEEGLTEAEFNRRIDALEEEHLQKRRDLRASFTSEDKAFIQQFRNWWESVAELDEVEWDGIEAEWRVARDRERKMNNAQAAKDLAKMRGIVVKQLNEIENIISKERPYDGITKNLQDNLIKMGVLFADMDAANKNALGEGKNIVFDDAAYVQQNIERVKFLLGEAENAYSLSMEQLMQKMREAGLDSWADALAADENGEQLKQALMAQLRTAYDAVQDAIKKEASQMKKQVEIQWNDALAPNGQSRKQLFESTLSALGLQEDQVKRANSLIGAGQASERVADKLAIKQMQVRLAMQEQYYAMLRKIGAERIAQLKAAGKDADAEHVARSLNLALSEEQKKVDEQRVAIANQLEESQNRLYKELQEWGTLIASSLQSVFEARNTGNAEYYNELAKMELTGKGGPGAGTYMVIDQAGTSDAKAHYEYLDERDALERQHEIEQQNAMADAWRKVMDDINMKMSETVTDMINASLQNQSLDLNTDATNLNTTAEQANTEAVNNLAAQMQQGLKVDTGSGFANDKQGGYPTAPEQTPYVGDGSFGSDKQGGYPSAAQAQIDASNAVTDTMAQNAQKQVKTTEETNKQITTSTQSAFAKMTQAANLYGVAYQAMSNENLSTSQKFQMIALQAIGNGAITALTTNLAQTEGEAATKLPGIFGKAVEQLGPIAGPIAFGAMTALLGGLMGMAVSKIAKSKSQIASVTGASVSAGRLSTGMQTYAEGNVNEFTDPASLTPGQQYTVDAADGRTYRARYMGANPRTHLTNGPEFHLSGERGREMIIDAGTTRQITMNEGVIWDAIQTLSNGGRVRHRSAMRRRGVAAFADGNIDNFAGIGDMTDVDIADMEAMRGSLDRNSAATEALLARLAHPIQAVFAINGPDGLVDSYDRGKKNAMRHGERY